MRGSRPSAGLRRLADFLASGRLAVLLLTVLVTLLGLYLFVPQRGQVEERLLLKWVEDAGLLGRGADALGLTDIQRSWLLWETYALLFVNLLLCMIRRARVAWRLWQVPETPPAPSPLWAHREVEAPEASVAHAAALLRRRGYRTRVVGSTVYGLRGRFAVVGHWLFHLGMLLLLVAGVIVALGPPSFRGTVGLGEGEAFDLHHSAYLGTSTGAPPSPSLPGLGFRLERVTAVPVEEGARELAATLRAADGATVRLAVNRPYRRSPYQVLIQGFGYMPGWVVVNQQGRALDGAWMKLPPVPMEEVADSFPLMGGEAALDVTFYPDHAEQDGKDATQSHELKNPRFRVRLRQDETTLHEGLLSPGERVRLGGGREFFFLPEIRRYALLDVIEEEGYAAVFGTLALVIAGLALRYARIRKEIVVDSADGVLRVSGRSELFEHLFAEEMDRLAGTLGQIRPAEGNLGDRI